MNFYFLEVLFVLFSVILLCYLVLTPFLQIVIKLLLNKDISYSKLSTIIFLYYLPLGFCLPFLRNYLLLHKLNLNLYLILLYIIYTVPLCAIISYSLKLNFNVKNISTLFISINIIQFLYYGIMYFLV